MEEAKQVNGRFSQKVWTVAAAVIQRDSANLCSAIEYIRTTQHNERSLHNEVQRLQRDAEFSREAHKENEMLKTEVQVMHQHLRRLDPNAPHVYGHFTSQLSQQHTPGQLNGNSGMSLPPLGAAQGGGQNAPAAPMQGVEYGYGR